MKPEVAVFSKESPCSKLEIWNCFADIGGFRNVQVDQAHAIIGKNVPRIMERQGYLQKVSGGSFDYYKLTGLGADWLKRGFNSYLRNHPLALNTLRVKPNQVFKTGVLRVTRTRPGK